MSKMKRVMPLASSKNAMLLLQEGGSNKLKRVNISIKKTDKLISTFKCKSIRCTLANDHLHCGISWSPLRYSYLLSLVFGLDRITIIRS